MSFLLHVRFVSQLQKSARMIEEYGGESWLMSLRCMNYKDAKKNLMKLCGVGAKVGILLLIWCIYHTVVLYKRILYVFNVMIYETSLGNVITARVFLFTLTDQFSQNQKKSIFFSPIFLGETATYSTYFGSRLLNATLIQAFTDVEV